MCAIASCPLVEVQPHTAAHHVAKARPQRSPQCHAGNKIQIAKALKEVVFFSNIVLTPLVAAVKEPSADSSRDDAMKEIAETLAKARKEVAAEEAREKAQQQSAAGEASADDADGSDFAEGSYRDESQAGAEATDSDKAATTASHGDAAASTADDAGAEAAGVADSSAEKMKKAEEEEAATGQKEIVVGEEVFDKQQRLEIYKTYLTFCMTGAPPLVISCSDVPRGSVEGAVAHSACAHSIKHTLQTQPATLHNFAAAELQAVPGRMLFSGSAQACSERTARLMNCAALQGM